MLTKEQERKLVAKLVAETPEGYVKDFLREAAPLWIDAINSDLAEAGIRELWRQKLEAKEELAVLTRRKNALEAQIRSMEADLVAQRAKAQDLASVLKVANLALQNGASKLESLSR